MVSIIIVNFNSKAFLIPCLSSIYESRGIKDMQVIVVDNQSRDGSASLVRKHFPNTQLIIRRRNWGFANSANLGAEKAVGRYLFFLNPDTIVLPDSIKQLTNFIRKRKHVIIGPKVVHPNGSLHYNCGYFPTIQRLILDRIPFIRKKVKTFLIRDEAFYDKRQQPDWISGVCMCIPKVLWQKLGGFDPRFFMYNEDLDLCFRARSVGIPVYYIPQSTIIHAYQGKEPERRWNKAYWIRQGLLLFFDKYYFSRQKFILNTLLRLEASGELFLLYFQKFTGIGINRQKFLEKKRYCRRLFNLAIEN